jgi:hypothetical protein
MSLIPSEAVLGAVEEIPAEATQRYASRSSVGAG